MPYGGVSVKIKLYRSKPKIQIPTGQVVRDIRGGADDSELMNTYGLSARGLERLFEKLILAGSIEQSELDRRMLSSGKSHVVELDAVPEPAVAKTRINSGEAITDIRAGLSDTDLMEKYGLSAKGLDSLFRKLVAADRLDASELDQRRRSLDWADLAFAPDSEDYNSEDPYEGDPADAEQESGRINRFIKKHKVSIAALFGCVGGAVIALVFMVVVFGFNIETGRVERDSESALLATIKALQKQADELIKTLEAIVGTTSGHVDNSPSPQASDREDCVKRCEKIHPGSSESERAQMLNCTRECIAKYSERIRRIRDMYHGVR
jgi:uncharacterized protein (DUF433 family)